MTPPKIESDLKILCQEAMRFGAAEEVASMASSVAVDIRANLKCQVPVCPHYGMCPPHIMTATEFQEILSKIHLCCSGTSGDFHAGGTAVQNNRGSGF